MQHIVLATKPGPLQQSLRTILQTVAPAASLHEIRNAAALSQIDGASEPGLLLLDANLPGMRLSDLQAFVSAKPRLTLVVLSENAEQTRAARAAGVHVVLPHGCHPERLIAVVKRHLDTGDDQISADSGMLSARDRTESEEDDMDNNNLSEILRWANMGTMRQFALETEARLRSEGDYEVRLEDDTMKVFRTRKEGGFLGIGGKEERELVFKAREEDGQTIVDEQETDSAFIDMLAGLLQRH